MVLSSIERHCPYVLSTIKITIACGIQNTPKPKITKEVAVNLLQWPRHSQPDDMRRIKGKHLLLSLGGFKNVVGTDMTMIL